MKKNIFLTLLLIVTATTFAFSEVVRSRTSVIYQDNINNRAGVNNNAPAYTLDVNGIVNAVGGILGNVTGASSLNVLKAGDVMTGPLAVTTLTVTGSAFSVGGSTLVVAGGNLSIGNGTAANIDVLANASSAASFRAQSGTVITAITGVAGVRGSMGTTSNHDVGILTNNTTQMLVGTSGNVGIGTTTVSEKLDVNGNIGLHVAGPSSGSRMIRLTRDAGSISGGAILFQGDASNTNRGMQLGRTDNSGLFYSQINIADTGNVSIATTTGVYRLTVAAGNIDGIGIVDPADLNFVRMLMANTAASGAYYEMWDVSEVSKVKVRTYGDSYFNGGNVGIGTAAPAFKVDVSSGAIGIYGTGAGIYMGGRVQTVAYNPPVMSTASVATYTLTAVRQCMTSGSITQLGSRFVEVKGQFQLNQAGAPSTVSVWIEKNGVATSTFTYAMGIGDSEAFPLYYSASSSTAGAMTYALCATSSAGTETVTNQIWSAKED